MAGAPPDRRARHPGLADLNVHHDVRLGILVDDSIVVIENVHRHAKMGESPIVAALNGRSETGMAAIATTLVDVVVSLPSPS